MVEVKEVTSPAPVETARGEIGRDKTGAWVYIVITLYGRRKKLCSEQM